MGGLIWLSLILIGGAMLLNAVRIVRGPSDFDRLLAGLGRQSRPRREHAGDGREARRAFARRESTHQHDTAVLGEMICTQPHRVDITPELSKRALVAIEIHFQKRSGRASAAGCCIHQDVERCQILECRGHGFAVEHVELALYFHRETVDRVFDLHRRVRVEMSEAAAEKRPAAHLPKQPIHSLGTLGDIRRQEC